MTLTKRSTKGSALTYTEMDDNFTHLGGDGSYTFPSTDGDSGKVLTTDGSGNLTFQHTAKVGPTVFSVQSISGPGAINLTDTVTLITTTGADQAFSLADGVEGQIKIISLKVDGGNAIVTPDNYVNGTTITFNATEDTIVLMYQTTGWVQLARQNATVS